jgi:2-polyprenyl-3-methyl-5-hydroxy-6-metoxy-1,4-benzoquinol methylase
MGTATRIARLGVPLALLGATVRRSARPAQRVVAGSALIGLWATVYARYRAAGVAQTTHERELLATANWEAFTRHYNERVPTIEEEFDLWGAYHQHRHEMRYDLVADAVRRALPAGGRVLDVGCGSALVADRLTDVDAFYVGMDFGGHHVHYAQSKLASSPGRLRSAVGQADGAKLPFTDGSFDVVVMSEVIEHLLRPELAVWEVARVLADGGTFIMTTNNASEVPLRSPLTHLFAWLEKAIGAEHSDVISLRPWVWPQPVDPTLLPDGSPPVYLPHTHHIQAETRRLFAAAGLDTVEWSTFEFPPPQSTTARSLEACGEPGRKMVDLIESLARRVPLVNRLGCHLLMIARKERAAVAPEPPAGVWPGPFSP